jgi:hypothetical protein
MTTRSLSPKGWHGFKKMANGVFSPLSLTVNPRSVNRKILGLN